MKSLEKWYREMGKQQKIFVYFVSVALIAAFGFGLFAACNLNIFGTWR